ncbi:hypothetical protein C8Q78DRAFT_623428 [Trametes maxima]|nr:hypothetical protein C8Q78DRAFT_623428 [Trametes maxima]
MSPEQHRAPVLGLHQVSPTTRIICDTAPCVQNNKEGGAARRSELRGSNIPNNDQYCASRPKFIAGDSKFSSGTTFSRHDSLFSFGASSTRNAAELKSFLGNASSARLKPGATVLPLMVNASEGQRAGKAQVVSLEQAKPRARVEVDIVLENDCCVEGGYLRGSIKLRIRKRQKNEAPVLLADGKVRVIGFESIPGETHRHAFYQRAGSLNAITDKHAQIYDSSPDGEGFSRAMEGVHVLPFAMHLPIDVELGSPRGLPCLPSGTSIRYIAMISVKVKHSKTGKRSIAHFYRDCQVWPRLDPATVFASAPRPIHATASGTLSVIGGGKKLKLTAMLPRLTWVAGQRCYVHLSVANETRKTVKSLTLTLVRTITLFKPKPSLDIGSRVAAEDPDACQTTTTHKVVSLSVLERGQGAAKGHASAQGWWTGVVPGQEAQFSHHILISPDALSIPRARLIEVEYSIQVSLSAGALASDVQVTLPIRVVNFLSLDPIPTAPLLSSDGSYARLVHRESVPDDQYVPGNAFGSGKSVVDSAPQSEGDHPVVHGVTSYSEGPQTRLPSAAGHRVAATDPTTEFYASEGVRSCPPTALHVVNPDCMSSRRTSSESDDGSDGSSLPYASEESATSLYSIDSYTSTTASSRFHSGNEGITSPNLGNLELSDGAGSSDEVDLILKSTQPTPQSDLSPPIHTHHVHHAPEAAVSSEPSRVPDGATPPSSPRLASSPHTRHASPENAHTYQAPRRSAEHHRSTSDFASYTGSPPRTLLTSHTDPAHRLAADATAITNAIRDYPVSRPARPARSPLRGRTGPRERRVNSEAGGEGLTSFERRVQEKKLALLGRAQSGPSAVPPEVHFRAPSECGTEPVSAYKAYDGTQSGDEGGRGIDGDSDGGGDVEATPRFGDHNVCLMGSTAALVLPAQHEQGSEMQARPSRQLPLPPPRSSRLSVASASDGLPGGYDIPPSISALDAMRASQLGRPSDPSGEQNSLASISYRAAQATPPQLVASISSSESSSGGSASCDAPAILHSLSGLGFRARPTEGLRNTGSSESSVVKGRIAAFEERLKSSQDNGAAYM